MYSAVPKQKILSSPCLNLLKQCFITSQKQKAQDDQQKEKEYNQKLERVKPFRVSSSLQKESHKNLDVDDDQDFVELWPTPLQLMAEVREKELQEEAKNQQVARDRVQGCKKDQENNRNTSSDETSLPFQMVEALPHAVQEQLKMAKQKEEQEEQKCHDENDENEEEMLSGSTLLNGSDLLGGGGGGVDIVPNENSTLTTPICRQLCLMTTIHGSTNVVTILSRVLY